MADTGAAAPAGASSVGVADQKDQKLLDEILSNITPDSNRREEAKDIVREFAQQVLDGAMKVSKDTESTLKDRIAQLDKLISTQLDEVMHHAEFQRLEATWRGLHYLVHESETSENLKIRVWNVSKKELHKDLRKAPEFDQSALFQKVYEAEFGQFGGSPYGCLLGDYEIENHPQDMILLQNISNVAAAAHAPFIAAASPKLFNLKSFEHLGDPRDIAKIFGATEYVQWKSFRESEDSRYVGLCLPRTLARRPYGPETDPVEAFNYEETVEGPDNSKYLWSNASWSFGARLTDAFAKYGWCTAIRGVEGGGLVEDLPTHTFRTDQGDVALKCPTEIAITDRREKELADAGFIPLVHCKGRDFAAFFSAQSVNRPKKYDTDYANANARLSSQLQYIFAVSRFAHYLKAMMRDKIGSFMSRQDCQNFLDRWIANYVTTDDTASQEVKAQFPLREASIEVQDVPGKPGAYKAIALLRPHFQLDEIDISLRLVAELPESKR